MERPATLILIAEPSWIASGVVDAAREGLRFGGKETVPCAEDDGCAEDAPEIEAEEDDWGVDDWEAVIVAEDEPETEAESLKDADADDDDDDEEEEEDPLTILIAPE